MAKQKNSFSKRDFDILKRTNWQYLVNRREALIFRSITDNSYKYFRDVAGSPWKVRFTIRSSDGELYHKKEELEKLMDIFLKGGKCLSVFMQRLILNVSSFDRTARKIEKKKCSELTKKQLVDLLDTYLMEALHAQAFLAALVIADKALSKMILELLPAASPEEKQRWLGILIYPTKENAHLREEKSFYNLARAYGTKGFDALLEDHSKRFAWIGARGYNWKNAWKKEEIIDRLNSFFAQKKDPDDMLRRLENIKKDNKRSAKELIRKLKIKKSSLLYGLILLAREYAYRRTWRTDIIYGSGYRARNMFGEIAKRVGIDMNDLAYFTFEEVIEMVKEERSPISQAELEKRKEYYVLVTTNNKSTVLSGKNMRKVFNEIVKQEFLKTDEVKGNIAFPGIANGKVNVVFTADDLRKVKLGDILVAVMTFPHFVPAMEKAAAFVTDEGGILCHAAIVSREMGKPCIIGTKIATKVFKDGDLVEVDADRGIVRKI